MKTTITLTEEQVSQLTKDAIDLLEKNKVKDIEEVVKQREKNIKAIEKQFEKDVLKLQSKFKNYVIEIPDDEEPPTKKVRAKRIKIDIELLKQYFSENKSLKEMAELFSITDKQVRLQLSKLKLKLRDRESLTK